MDRDPRLFSACFSLKSVRISFWLATSSSLTLVCSVRTPATASSILRPDIDAENQQHSVGALQEQFWGSYACIANLPSPWRWLLHCALELL